MDLSPEQVAAAEARGIRFPVANPSQVQRLSMQCTVFRIGGALHLATWDGSLFETTGTLQRLIAEGLRQPRHLAVWKATARHAQQRGRRPVALRRQPKAARRQVDGSRQEGRSGLTRGAVDWGEAERGAGLPRRGPKGGAR